MRTDEETAVREAVLDLALSPSTADITHQAVAEQTGIDEQELFDAWPDVRALLAFAVQPLTTAVDDLLRRIPIHQYPTVSEQRQTLSALLSASLEFPRHQAVVIRILTSTNREMARRADQFAYQAGIRLLGVNYESKSDLMTRVFLVTEMIALAVCTPRYDFTDEHTRNLVLDSLLAALNPASLNTPDPSLRPRWSDRQVGRQLHPRLGDDRPKPGTRPTGPVRQYC